MTEMAIQSPRKTGLSPKISELIEGMVSNASKVKSKNYASPEPLTASLAKKLKSNLKLMRSQALYLLDISIQIGKGTSNIQLRLEDIKLPKKHSGLLEEKNIKTMIPVSKILQQAKSALYCERAKIMDTYYKRFGQLWVVPEENFVAVQEALKKLYEVLDKQRAKILDSYNISCRQFLQDIADICASSRFDYDKTRIILEYYLDKFPKAADIQNNLQITISPPIKLPSISEMMLEDARLAEAQTTYLRENLAQERLSREQAAVREVLELAKSQIKEHLGEIIDQARSHFLGLVNERLQYLLKNQPINNAAEKRKFQNALKEMQRFIEYQDSSITGMFAEIQELGELLQGKTYTADSRRQELIAKIEQFYRKHEPQFQSFKVEGTGHRFRAIASLEM
ncbi:hypothetical protein FD723_40300 (plasmid) [Nostoc sp. C052]|uniref:hypothetical protein n=1 Tax=Nostoc sp. C052 TaxID=2576902 RepID=UPI0015C30F4F|nr:hypothetical protein [Nostoc sp. C052]QLE46456.1 hypothetical protein FD723_40300 [Nostoc sp. C052]